RVRCRGAGGLGLDRRVTRQRARAVRDADAQPLAGAPRRRIGRAAALSQLPSRRGARAGDPHRRARGRLALRVLRPPPAGPARPEAIEAVRANGPLDALTPRERLVVEVVRSLYRTRSLPGDLYARATAELETPQLVELVTLAGYYGMIAFVLLSFEVDLPAGA